MAQTKRGIRIALLALAGCVFIGFSGGCGSKPDGTETTSATEATTASVQTTATPETTTSAQTSAAEIKDNLNRPGQLPVVKERETLRVALFGPTMLSLRPGVNALTDWLTDQTNIALEFVVYPAAEAANVESLLSAGSDLGDICLLTDFPLSARAQAVYGADGLLVPLDGMMEQYAYHLSELLEAYDYSDAALRSPDGHIYSFPTGQPRTFQPDPFGMQMWINGTFLDRYSMGLPRSTEEFEAYLNWAVHEDANRNGSADEIGWTGSEKRETGFSRPTDFLMNAYVLQNENGYYQQDDTLYAAFNTDAYREGLIYLARLMENGLMDPEYPSNTKEDLARAVARNSGETVAAVAADDLSFITDEAVRATYRPLPPLEGPAGRSNAYYDAYSGLESGTAFIPSTSGNKELAFAWMDVLYTQDVWYHARYGEQGIDWIVPPDETIAPDGGPALFQLVTNPDTLSPLSVWDGAVPARWDRAGVYAGLGASLDVQVYEAAKAYAPFVTPCSVPDYYFPDPRVEADAFQLERAIQDVCRSGVTEFIYGTRDIRNDASWGAFTAELDQAGLTEYLDILQQAHDRAWKGTLPATYTPPAER